MPATAALEQLERVLARQRVGEEEPQQRLVPQLDREVALLVSQPSSSLRPALVSR